MLPKSQRPHFIRTLNKQKQKNEKNKHKFFLLILKRICHSKIKSHLHQIIKIQQQQYSILNHAFKRVERNLQFVKLMAWKKIICYSKLQKKDQRFLKIMLIFANQQHKYWMNYGFRKLYYYTNRIALQNYKKVQNYKDKAIAFTINSLFLKIIKHSFIKIKSTSALKKTRQFRSIILIKQVETITMKRIYFSWNRIMSLGNAEHKDIQHQLGQLNNQLESMRRQIIKKQKQIQQLKSQTQDKRNQIIHYNSIRQRNSSLENSRKSFKSVGSKKGSSQDLSQKRSQIDSADNNNNTSILQWLNNSFLSIKSGKSSKSRSIAGFECNCKYRQKYNKYRAEASSMKNQLQIIKSQLQVTKQLNQHLQQQISNLCLGPSQSPELAMLRKQVKQLRKQKQNLRDKLIKTQKYIAHLKYQFKMKIQNLYRNLKKTNN